MKISKKAQTIPASMTLEITAKVKQMKKENKSVIGFTAGEPDFNTPEYIIDSAKHALDIGFTKYTPASGMIELKQAICNKLKNDNNLEYSPDQIIISSGAKSCLFHAIYSIIDEGDEVLIPSPFWFSYEEQVKLAGGKVKVIKTEKKNNYKLTAEELEKSISSKTVCLILNSPCNPTGSVYSKEELIQLSRVIEKNKLMVISDEIYEKLVYDNIKFCSFPSISQYMKENSILINGMSKSYSMTGWRIGYLACPKQLATIIGRVQSHTISNACSFAQYASVTALNSGDEIIEKMRQSFDERRKLIMKRLNKISTLSYLEPKGAFYVFIDISNYIGKQINNITINDSLDFANELLHYGVAVIPGNPFYANNFIRLSYAISIEDINEGINRIEMFLKDLK